MCVSSTIGDYFTKRWDPYVPVQPYITTTNWLFNQVSREEFEQLRNEVREMIDLMKKAKEIDDYTGQKDCEQDKKIALLKLIAKEFGYDLDFLGGNNAKTSAATSGTAGSAGTD